MVVIALLLFIFLSVVSVLLFIRVVYKTTEHVDEPPVLATENSRPLDQVSKTFTGTKDVTTPPVRTHIQSFADPEKNYPANLNDSSISVHQADDVTSPVFQQPMMPKETQCIPLPSSLLKPPVALQQSKPPKPSKKKPDDASTVPSLNNDAFC